MIEVLIGTLGIFLFLGVSWGMGVMFVPINFVDQVLSGALLLISISAVILLAWLVGNGILFLIG